MLLMADWKGPVLRANDLMLMANISNEATSTEKWQLMSHCRSIENGLKYLQCLISPPSPSDSSDDSDLWEHCVSPDRFISVPFFLLSRSLPDARNALKVVV
ncbi:hypothetical protein Ciccas_005651 [Cichlidogyrus casuarinus]|uniref:Uncharacterized protein n=1 Tax=Cichlidogyrus casuarinus TaxID=1844966 RepID=A0ABD2Q827_9PLAT